MWGFSEFQYHPTVGFAPMAERDPTSVSRPADTSSHKGRRTWNLARPSLRGLTALKPHG